MLPKSNKTAYNLLVGSIMIVIFITSLICMLLFVGDKMIFKILKAPSLIEYKWLIPAAVFFNGINLALTYWNSRIKKIGKLSIARIIN